MPNGRTSDLIITLSPTDAATLHAWQRSTKIKAGLACRGRMVLLRAQGASLTTIAATVGRSRRHVDKWLRRFLESGVAGLMDHPRQPPPASLAPWSPQKALVAHLWAARRYRCIPAAADARPRPTQRKPRP